jgi:hypothetical protein
MHNRLIFLYHHDRVQRRDQGVQGLSSDEPGPLVEVSEGGTQEGSSAQALVVLG